MIEQDLSIRRVGVWVDNCGVSGGLLTGLGDSGQLGSMYLEGMAGLMAARVIGWFSKCTVDGERE